MLDLASQHTLASHFGSSVVIDGSVGRGSSFEVTLSLTMTGGALAGTTAPPQLLYSKLQTGKFPDAAQLIADIEAWAQTGTLPPHAPAQPQKAESESTSFFSRFLGR